MLSSSEVQHLAELVMQSKRKLGQLHSEVFARIRGACNPYERIGKADFVCRSAPKLAVLDLLFDLVASSAVNGRLLFADICASPGGFSEYILRRSVQCLAIECVGWGISLVDRNQQGEACAWEIDGILQEFGVEVRTSSDRNSQAANDDEHAGRTPSPTAIYHVSAGADGTGDLYKPENIEYFVQREVRAAGGGVECVDLVVADGGFDYTQRHEIQEAASFKLILCEALAMFKLLRVGGNFVVKVFDVAQRETQELLRCLAAHFAATSIVKPVARCIDVTW
jgi:cap1 methyltransferase